MTFWTDERVAFLFEHYQSKGRDWCAEQLGATSSQVRQKTSRLQLKSLRNSDAHRAASAKHALALTGKKRPEQSAVMLRLHAEGKLDKTPAQCAAIGAATRKRIAEHGHPRGALGMKHTDEAKAIIGTKAAQAWANTTEQQRYERLVAQMKTREANGTIANERPNTSWRAGWREIGGVRKYYRSQWEANYAHYLQWLKEKGQIADWKHEPKTFWFEGIRRGSVSYLPDFWVKENSGAESYHEVKGWMDDRSKTKIKRMAKYHPTVKLVVIDTKGYRALKASLMGLVPGWEQSAR